jgi:predicted transcriptional regulator
MQMIDRGPVEDFAKFFGLRVYEWRKQPNYNGDLTTVYKVMANSDKACKTIRTLLPYLRCPHKIDNAELCMTLRARVQSRKGYSPRPKTRGGSSGLSEAELAAREVLFQQAKANNEGRGVRLMKELNYA